MFVETVLKARTLISVATKFGNLYFIMLNEGILFARLVYTRPWTSKVSCSFFYYNEGTGILDSRSQQDLKSVRLHFAYGRIALTHELLCRF